LQRRYTLMRHLFFDLRRGYGVIEDHTPRQIAWSTPNPRWMHAHINCSCWDIEGPGPERRRQERQWRREEGLL
jgi:hypothetical protein